jgi:lysophospholipase L1-like esterase
MRILCLGDSYTVGESVPFEHSWPGLLQARAAESGVHLALDIIARTGWAADELLSAWHQREASGSTNTYDFVTLSTGVNNQYRKQTTEPFRFQFAALLGHALRLTGGDAKRIAVISIPDWGQTPFAEQDPRGAEQIGAEIDTFNRVKQAAALQIGAHFIDITPSSRGNLSGRLADDGLHPGQAMYADWVSVIWPVVSAVDTRGRECAQAAKR